MDRSQLPAAVPHEQITADLRARGFANATIDELPVTIEMWRRIARASARSLGRPVQTLLVGNGAVTAVLPDWPATPEERAVQDASMRDAMRRLPSMEVPTALPRK